MKGERKQRKVVASNSIYLFMLTFSNYFLYLLTIPYQTRTLGPEVFGLVGFAMAAVAYFKIAVDFGFMISATEKISLHRDNQSKVSKILSDVLHAKLWLTVLSMAIMLLLFAFVPVFRDNFILFTLFFVGAVAKSFQPDFVYRGIEKMRTIAVRTVTIQGAFLALMFALVKSPEDVLWVPALDAIGSVAALLFTAKHLKSMGLTIHKSSAKDTLTVLKEGLWFFYSRIATNIYTATNIFVIGLIHGSSSQILGLYTAADRLATAGKQAVTPVVDSMYPYMVRRKDFRLMKRVLLIGSIVMVTGCTFVAVFANDISAIIFGHDYYGAGEYLRVLTIVVFLSFPSMLLGFPVLSPLGLAKHANISNIIAALSQIIQIIILFVTDSLSVINICIITCITEVVALSYRAYTVFMYLNKQKYERSQFATKK